MAFKKHDEEYDWLNDPFDEKKMAEEQRQARMSSGTKVALGCGCLVVIVGIVLLLIFGFVGFMSALS